MARDPAVGCRARKRLRRGPLPSAVPRPRPCPPWRCRTGCSASCAVHTFCPNAEERTRDAGGTHCNLGGSGCACKPPGLNLSRGAGWGFCCLDSSMKKTSRGSNHAEPQVPHGTENFLAVPEPRGDARRTRSIHSKCPLMLYFSQISTEREAQAVSITGDNSRRKMKA